MQWPRHLSRAQSLKLRPQAPVSPASAGAAANPVVAQSRQLLVAATDDHSAGRFAPEAVSAFVGLGANLGDAPATLAWAVQALAELPHSRVRAVSSLYASAPLDCEPGSPDFFNAVVQLQTALSAPDVLHALWRLERQAGRQRPYRNAPRTLDLDLLLYGEAHMASAQLTVPHPRMHQRAFVLQPLAEIAPQRVSAAQLQAVANQGVQQAGPLEFCSRP